MNLRTVFQHIDSRWQVFFSIHYLKSLFNFVFFKYFWIQIIDFLKKCSYKTQWVSEEYLDKTWFLKERSAQPNLQVCILWEICLEERCSIGYCIRAISYCFFFSFNMTWKFLKLRVFSLNIKMLSRIDGAYLFTILKTLIIIACKFLWWIVISLFFSNKFPKLFSLSPLTIQIDHGRLASSQYNNN